MKCPVCKDVTLLMSEKHGVEIDYCPQCRGIWLDRGELDKIIQRAKEIQREYDRDEDRYERRDYDRDSDRKRYQSRDKEYDYDREYRKEKDRYDDSYYRKKKKKSSMFGELFEMFGGEGDLNQKATEGVIPQGLAALFGKHGGGKVPFAAVRQQGDNHLPLIFRAVGQLGGGPNGGGRGNPH